MRQLLKIKEIEQPVPGAAEVHDYQLQDLSLPEIEQKLDLPNNWEKYGFNAFYFLRRTATVYILKTI